VNQVKLVFLSSLIFSFFNTHVFAKSKAKTMRFTIVESWSEPYAFFDSNGNLTGGAMKDIIEEIGKKVGVPVEFVYLSRNRVDAAMEKGAAEIRCYINEAWTNRPTDYLFSQPIFQTSNSIIWKKGRKPITNRSDIEGKTIGTVAGYVHKSIDGLFKSGKAKRSDAVNEAMNTTLLLKDRIDYAIVETTSFNWTSKQSNEMGSKDVESFLLDVFKVKCSALKKNSERFKLVESALEKMKLLGVMRAIETKYGLK
jgi:polar amino acid transport system substrate-binding protein